MIPGRTRLFAMFKYATALSVLLSTAVSAAQAAIASSFAPPSTGPLVQSGNYTGWSNSTLPKYDVISGKAFDRFIQIWLENTDFSTAAASPVFQQLAQQGLLLTSYYAVTHPSEPNYIAAIGGDFFGLGDDNYYHIPSNISSIVDILESKNISWASYAENQPWDGYSGFNYTSHNYLNSSAPPYAYYVRKHTPTTIFDSVNTNSSRNFRVRNFNDFANDAVNSTLPQWSFITPNMVNDAHDTTIEFASDWLSYWLVPLLNDTRFNDDKTIILLTFDENETYDTENFVYTLILGGALPSELKNTTDTTFYTHYSALSTVQANWDLPSLGRQDTNKTMSNVFDFVAKLTGYTNVDVANKPLTNLTGIFAGPLNAEIYTPFTAPNTSAVGAGAQSVYVASGVNQSITQASLSSPVNLTSQNEKNPWALSTAAASNSSSSASPSSSSSSHSGAMHSLASSGLAAMVLTTGMLLGAAVALF